MSGVIYLVDENGETIGSLRGTPNNEALVHVTNGMITYAWAGAGTGNAPPAGGLANFTYGVSENGANVGVLYWVINGVWISTGATVQQLHGGA